MARAYIGIGLPGSGKTTYLRQFAADIDAVYVCADDVRAEWYGDASVQIDSEMVWSEVRRRARKALMAGRDVVIDGVHCKQSDRAATIRACNSAEAVVGIWCQAPFKVCMARNLSRERVVPAYAMKRMRNQLYRNPPSKREGFTRIERVNTAG
jgi:predicted kinase